MTTTTQSISEGWRLTIRECSRAHRGPVYGFLVLWPQIATEPFALFHHSFCDYMCCTNEVADHYADRAYENVCNLELRRSYGRGFARVKLV